MAEENKIANLPGVTVVGDRVLLNVYGRPEPYMEPDIPDSPCGCGHGATSAVIPQNLLWKYTNATQNNATESMETVEHVPSNSALVTQLEEKYMARAQENARLERLMGQILEQLRAEYKNYIKYCIAVQTVREPLGFTLYSSAALPSAISNGLQELNGVFSGDKAFVTRRRDECKVRLTQLQSEFNSAVESHSRNDATNTTSQDQLIR
jgi:hypothetical protein